MVMDKAKRVYGSNWILFLLASLHLTAALSHFILSVISKYVAKDIHYGNQACVPIPYENASIADCSLAKDNQTCGTNPECKWEYTGLGLDYQLLAGPSFMAIFTTTSIFWGFAADRFNRLYLLVACSFIFSLAMILTAFTTQFWQLVALRMMLASGVAGISPIVPGIIFDAFPEKHRALAMGFFHWGIYLGGGLSNAIGKIAVTDIHIFTQGWRGAFLISGVPGFIIGILMLLTGEDPPKTHKGHEGDFHSHMHHGHATSACPRVDGNLKLHINAKEVDDDYNDDQDEDVVEFEASEAHVLIESNKSHTKRGDDNNVAFSMWSCCMEPPVLLLGIGACIRQSAGYTWGYNSALYYQTLYPEINASGWLTWITIFSGTSGVIAGSAMSDRLVSRFGLSGRTLVLAISQLVSFPFALGTLWCDPPLSFFCLILGYFFAEMWYGVVFAVLVELLPQSIRSLGMAVALFIINNVGGNVPVLVSPLSKLLTYRTALTFLYPGSLLTSSFFFFMGYIAISKK